MFLLAAVKYNDTNPKIQRGMFLAPRWRFGLVWFFLQFAWTSRGDPLQGKHQ